MRSPHRRISIDPFCASENRKKQAFAVTVVGVEIVLARSVRKRTAHARQTQAAHRPTTLP